MSLHWGLKNTFLPVSCNQFKQLAEQFQSAVACEFGTGTQLKLTALSKTPVFCTYDDDISESYRLWNEKNTFLIAQSLDSLTPEVWKRAAYVRVTLTPADESVAPASAFATMEGKGLAHRNVSFYVQPTGNITAQDMSRKNPFMRFSEGQLSNAAILGYAPVN